MKRSKLFWRSLLMSLAVILPFYLVVAAYGFSRAAPVQEIRTDVPITHPTSTDAKTLLVMTGAEEPEHFVLLRFDAMENRVATMAVPAQLAVPGTGGQQSLLQAVQSAGPAQAAELLYQVLGVPVSDYVYCDGELLAQLTAGLGNASMSLANYMSAATLGELQLSIPGVGSMALNTELFSQVLQAGAANPERELLLRAEGYLAFLKAGMEHLTQVLPDAMRTAVSQCSTALTATKIYDYERIFRFLEKQSPECRSFTLPGEYGEDGLFRPGRQADAVVQSFLSGDEAD